MRFLYRPRSFSIELLELFSTSFSETICVTYLCLVVLDSVAQSCDQTDLLILISD